MDVFLQFGCLLLLLLCGLGWFISIKSSKQPRSHSSKMLSQDK
uniref:Uncharacterized protein n=1 Tax=Rhizophora mucronata TaxID=61149 RepID=A0A2P2MUZ0_RHIMU